MLDTLNGSSTASKALTIAFMILSKENSSLVPSRLVMVNFFTSIIGV